MSEPDILPFPSAGGGGLRGGSKIPRVDHGFLQQVKSSPDAESRNREFHYHVFDEATGGAFQVAQREEEDAAEGYQEANKLRKELEKRLRNEPQYMDSPASLGGGENRDVPFPDWGLTDKITTGLALGVCTILLIMGVVNVSANLINSGSPVFVESPWMAVVLAMIVPAMAVAMEAVHHFMSHSTTRRIYKFAVFGIGIISALAWTIVFSIQFGGLNAGIDLDVLLTAGGDHGNAVLVWTQIAAETTLGAALFMVADSVSLKYTRGTRVLTPGHIEAKADVERHIPVFEATRKRYAAAQKAFAEINAARERFIGQALAALAALKNS
ncbi:MAG: hypothetical protein R2748_35680 [Bryobacterales bacterium]